MLVNFLFIMIQEMLFYTNAKFITGVFHAHSMVVFAAINITVSNFTLSLFNKSGLVNLKTTVWAVMDSLQMLLPLS